MTDKSLKEELKAPDEFQMVFGRWFTSLFSHSRSTLTVLIAAVVLIAVGIGWQVYDSKRNAVAADDFRKISESLNMTDAKATEQRLADLNAFLTKNGSSSLAPTAWLLKGKTLLTLGKYPEALDAYRTAGEKLPKPYSYLAQEGEGNALMEQKKWPEAETVWKTLTQKKDNPLRAEHVWKLGVTQEARNDASAALQTYKGFETEFQSSPMLEKVRGRIASLQKK